MSAARRGSGASGVASPEGKSEARSSRRALLFVRGVLAASALGLYTIAGGVGAFLALLPAALRPPARRGRAAPASSPLPAAAAASSREPIAG